MDIVAAYHDNLRARPERLALVQQDVRMTWGDVAHLSGLLLDTLAGVPANAAIGVLARTRPAMVAVFASLFMARRTSIMMHAFQPRLALIAQLREKGVAALVADAADVDAELESYAHEAGMRLIAVETRAAHLVVPGGPWSPANCLTPAGEPGSVMVLTSGTTGTPKHIALPRSVVEAAAISAMGGYGFSADPGAEPLVTILAMPLGNISGIYNVVPAVAGGATLCLLERFTVAGYLELIRRHPQRFIGLPPAALKMIVDSDLPDDTFAGISHCMCGAAPVPPAVQAAFEARFRLPVLQAYGATEFGGVIVMWTLADHAAFAEAKRGSAGRALPGVTLRIVDPASGAILPAGTDGRLEARVDRLGPAWISTNDLAMIDADGFVFIRGRADDMIMRGGFKVDPEMINNALRQNPAVADAATDGRPDERLGEVPVTLVELRPGHSAEPEALHAWLRERIVAYALPVEIRLVDALPRNPSLKVDKRELARLVA